MDKPDQTTESSAANADSLWLQETQWQNPMVIHGDSPSKVFAVFIVVANLLSWSLLLLLPSELANGNYSALMVLLFPAITSFIGSVYLHLYRADKYFGRTTLRLDPYPGAIGGDVGGVFTIDKALPLRGQAKVSLSQVYSYKRRNEREDKIETKTKVHWKTEGIADIVQQDNQTHLRFRFSLPDGLQPSQPPADDRHFWQVGVEAAFASYNYNRVVEIPVLATAASTSLPIQDSSQHADEVSGNEQILESMLNIRAVRGGVDIYIAPFRKKLSHGAGIVFGLAFLFIAWMIFKDGNPVVALIFTLAGGSLAWQSLQALLKGLHVRLTDEGLYVKRLMAGVVIKKSFIRSSNIKGLRMNTEGASIKTGSLRSLFSIDVVGMPDQAVRIVEELDNYHLAKQAVDSLSALTGYKVIE